MTDASTIGDPVRQQVEATLHRAIADVAALPCHLVRAVERRVAGPVGIARTVVTLAVGSLFGRPPAGEAPTPTAVDDAAPPPPSGHATAASDTGPAVAAAAADLPIEDYESLAASHVVARLERLDDAGLDAIERFEAAHRGRRTILGKIEQLRAER